MLRLVVVTESPDCLYIQTKTRWRTERAVKNFLLRETHKEAGTRGVFLVPGCMIKCTRKGKTRIYSIPAKIVS